MRKPLNPRNVKGVELIKFKDMEIGDEFYAWGKDECCPSSKPAKCPKCSDRPKWSTFRKVNSQRAQDIETLTSNVFDPECYYEVCPSVAHTKKKCGSDGAVIESVCEPRTWITYLGDF